MAAAKCFLAHLQFDAEKFLRSAKTETSKAVISQDDKVAVRQVCIVAQWYKNSFQRDLLKPFWLYLSSYLHWGTSGLHFDANQNYQCNIEAITGTVRLDVECFFSLEVEYVVILSSRKARLISAHHES